MNQAPVGVAKPRKVGELMDETVSGNRKIMKNHWMIHEHGETSIIFFMTQTDENAF